MLTRDETGRRAVREIGAGMVVDVGVGMPTPPADRIGLELGVMDLAPEARRLVVLMTQPDSGGEPKPVRRCALPPAAPEVVDRVSPLPRVADVGADPAPATEGGRV